MFTKDLSANVPLYGQEQCTWCGAASGQMARNGYPNPADRLFYKQSDVWNVIQAHNSTSPADADWATDPHGLTGCLQSLANPAGVHWVEFANPSQASILFSMFYWMNVRNYPSPVLVDNGGHWVLVVGYATDVPPTAGSSPILQSISYHDPEPHNVGSDTLMSAAQWVAVPWHGPITYDGTWLNQYVAVIEPPLQKGIVKVQPVKRTGTKLIPPSQAAKDAKRWIIELKLGEMPRYSVLAKPNVDNFEPMLVREEPPGIRAKNVPKNVPHYYIVPFGFKTEFSERGSRLARVCVLVNAYTGDFEEVTAFGSPVRYLSKDEALSVVGAALQSDIKRLRDADCTLMFQPSDITHVRTFPFWRIKVGNRILYVDQLGKLYGKLLPSIPGD